MKWLAIALGGAAGSAARYAVGGWVQAAGGARFPWGTAAVNLLGCLLIGLLAEWLGERALLPAAWRLPLLVGFLGAFTTFSTFAWENLQLLEGGRPGAALLNLLLQPACGLAGVWLGALAGRALAGG